MAGRPQSAPTAHDMYTLNDPTSPEATRSSNRIAELNEQSSVVDARHLPSPTSEVSSKGTKRERPHDLHQHPAIEPVSKKSRPSTSTKQHSHHDFGDSNSDYGAEISWADYFGRWPPMEVDKGNAGQLRKKRSGSQLRSSSYTQSVRDGESPQAWTRQHEEKMEGFGLVMSEYQSQAAITSACRCLCNDIKNRDCSPPGGPSFERDRLLKLLHSVRFRNEARIVRDIMPLVVPSPELLSIDGQHGMDQMSEAMDAEWVQCNTICGPRPKPDFVVGISPSAFTGDEKEKLRLSHTSACPNLFPENMYYPFLICEVKGSDRPMKEAERQSMHSASIAVQAIIQLYRKIDAVDEVDQKILAFSVAHNNDTVKIFGHFARIEEQKLSFFRCSLYTANLATDFASDDWARSYSIVRAIYDLFFPQHLSRITAALSRLPVRAMESVTLQLGPEEGFRESAASQPSSQERGTFKRPSLPSTNRMQQENDKLRDQLAGLLHQMQLQREQQRAESREQMANSREQMSLLERQMTQQKEQMERQITQQREQMERELTRQKEQMERELTRQKEEAQERKLMMEHQLAQQTEIITLLKERDSK